MQRTRSLFFCLGSVLILAWACGLFSPSAPAQDDTDTAEKKADEKTTKSEGKTHTVKAGKFRIETKLDGIVEAEFMTEISLRPEVFKTLEVVKAVSHGAEVKKGQLLVQLETKDLEDQIHETQLAVELGELSLKEAEENLDYIKATAPLTMAQAERSQMIARRELRQYQETDRPLAVRSAKQSLKSSKGQLENATEELRQLEKMYKADDLTEETEEIILKRARRSVESAELYVELAKVRADRTLAETIPEREKKLSETATQQDLTLEKLKVTLPMERRKQEIALEKLKRSQKDLVEKLEKLEGDLDLLDVKAPVEGVVYYGRCQDGKWSSIDTVAKQMEPGKTLTANQVFLTIVKLRPLRVRISLSEKDVRHVKKGMVGIATPTAYPDEKLDVVINSVDRIPDGSTKFDAVGSLGLEKNDNLVPGMTCKVNLVTYEKKNAITVPEKAVFEEEDDSDKKFVYLLGKNNKPTKVPVTVGKKDDGQVEITAGLNAGEKILTEKPQE